jgi:cardiolipin synthase
MSADPQLERNGRDSRRVARVLAEGAFSRSAGAPLIEGNQVRLLKDALENYPAWMGAIRAAKQHIQFESYCIHEDDVGREFADALIAKAGQGVRVRIVYDWMGARGKTSKRFWNRLRAAGIEVRCYNPPRLDSPFGWVSRDHRKMLAVDGQIGFISGLCVGMAWVGDPARKIEPWRDTGVEVRGNAVADVERAFAHVWATLGEPIPEAELICGDSGIPAGDTSVRVVATVPMTAGMSRVDELVAALARKRLWLTDAYYAGTTSFVQALKAAAKDGVDVRLLVPNGTDIPLLRPLSRAGYRPLLEAGVRVFEWNGAMLHAKTAVADGRWARVGSSNLNISSWFGNCELDLVVEDDSFAREMEEMYVRDLTNATEIVLDIRNKIRAPGEPLHPHPVLTSGGSVGRAAAGALRIGSAVGAAFTNRRAFEPVEARILVTVGTLLLGLAILLVFLPAVLVYPAVVLFLWMGAALLYRAYNLHRKHKQDTAGVKEGATPECTANRHEKLQSNRH